MAPLTHQEVDARSLALHRLVADKVRAQPELMARARSILERWIAMAPPNEMPYLLAWRDLLQGDLEACLAVAVSDSQEATALRQSSPLSCLLSNEERFRFLREWRKAQGYGAKAPGDAT